ncbi:unnamed protein product, partial [Allacma fusca]
VPLSLSSAPIIHGAIYITGKAVPMTNCSTRKVAKLCATKRLIIRTTTFNIKLSSVPTQRCFSPEFRNCLLVSSMAEEQASYGITHSCKRQRIRGIIRFVTHPVIKRWQSFEVVCPVIFPPILAIRSTSAGVVHHALTVT